MRAQAALCLVAVAGLAVAAGADEAMVTLDSPVSDRDFHRAVACAARPGGACRDAMVRWGRSSRKDLRIALLPPEPGHPATIAAIVDVAVDQAIAEINAVGAGVRLCRVGPQDRLHVRVLRRALREGDATRAVPGFPDGWVLGFGAVHAQWNGERVLERATVLLAADIRIGDIQSVVLEEMVQALGLLADVRGAGYEGRTIFDDASNAVTRLSGQDAAAIRLHYPPQ